MFRKVFKLTLELKTINKQPFLHTIRLSIAGFDWETESIVVKKASLESD